MTRTALVFLMLALGLPLLPGCPPESDDDDSAVDDDDTTTGDDDDMTASDNVADSEPNDVYPFQDMGVLDVGRTVITGTLTTAGASASQFFAGDMDLFTFQLVNAASVDFSLAWNTAGDDLDVLLFASLNDTSVLSWDSPNKITESASTGRPEEFTSPLSGNVDYTVLVGNFDGDPNAAYTLTIDVN